jgi:hypothetical protein
VVGGAVTNAAAFNLDLARMAGPYGVQKALVVGSLVVPLGSLMMRSGNADRRQVPIHYPLCAGTCRPLPLGPPSPMRRVTSAGKLRVAGHQCELSHCRHA